MKSSTVVLLLCAATQTLAAEVSPTTFTTPEFKAHLRAETSDLLAEHTQRANECAERGMRTQLSSATLESIRALSLSKDEATAALLYLALKAQQTCVGDRLAFQAISHLRYARSLGVEGFAEQDDPSGQQMSAILFDSEHAIRAQYVYSQIPSSKREALERMGELGKPFSITRLSRLTRTD